LGEKYLEKSTIMKTSALITSPGFPAIAESFNIEAFRK